MGTILVGMLVHKFQWLVLAAVMAEGAFSPAQALAADTPAAPLAKLTENHREFLARLARRTVRDALWNRSPYEPQYVPDGLQGVAAEAVVRLRQHGYLLGAGAGGPSPLAQATRDAALAAAAGLIHDREIAVALVDDFLVEIEIAGPSEPIPAAGDWRKPGVVDGFVEPGIHGLALQGTSGVRRICPSEMFTADLALGDALKLLAQGVKTDPSQAGGAPLLRFRTVHWCEPVAGASTVLLHRGMTLVPPEAVSRAGLDGAIARLAEYIAYRQLPSGLFTYQFEPGLDQYSDEDNLVRQVGTVVAVSVHARLSRKSASLAAADTAIRYHLQGLTDIPSIEGASFIATLDKRNKLGVTALLSVALAQHPNAEQYDSIRKRLMKGMLSLQRPSGMFVTAFPPAEEISGQDYYPGEALLALALEYDRRPTADILGAFDRAISFYRDYFRDSRSPAFVPWQVQAFALVAQQSKRRDYVDYVFELTDWLAEKQLTPMNCEWPELRGGVAAKASGRAGVATASYLEGFTDALMLARSVGDRGRGRRYETVVREAARFVMQLQVRPEEAYFMRSPQDAVGGIRTAGAVNKLRIDHCQHALLGLMKTRRALYPDEG